MLEDVVQRKGYPEWHQPQQGASEFKYNSGPPPSIQWFLSGVCPQQHSALWLCMTSLYRFLTFLSSVFLQYWHRGMSVCFGHICNIWKKLSDWGQRYCTSCSGCTRSGVTLVLGALKVCPPAKAVRFRQDERLSSLIWATDYQLALKKTIHTELVVSWVWTLYHLAINAKNNEILSPDVELFRLHIEIAGVRVSVRSEAMAEQMRHST